MIKILFNIFKRDQQSIKWIKMSKLKRGLLSLLIVVIILGVFASILVPVLLHADELQELIPWNIGILAMMICFYLTFILAIISAIGFTFSSGYLDKNLDNYSVLPINKREFVIAKLALVYYNVISLVILISVPFIIIYLVFAKISLIGILAIIIYTFTMPLVVIYFVTIILGTLMYFVNKVKNKALAKNVLFSLFFIVAFGLYLAFVITMSSLGEDNSLAQVTFIVEIIQKVGVFFFYSDWASNLLIYEDIKNLLLMMVVFIGGSISILYFEKVYFKGSLGFNEGGIRSKSTLRKNSKLPHYSMTKWFFIKEAKDIFKTGTYFFNSVMGNILIVVIYLGMMGYYYFFQSDTASVSQEITTMINNYLDIEIIIIITIVIGTFFTLFNNGAATIFSREAKSLDFINSLPLKQSRAFFGKVVFHGLVEFLTLFIFMIIPMLVLKISVVYIIASILVMFLIILATILLPVCLDLRFPNLDWESETAVVKRSKSIWMTMIAHLILISLVLGGCAALYFVLDIDYKIISYLVVGYYVIMSIVMIIIYRKLIDAAFKKVRN
ncbi:hypothetical protein LJB88_02245 [Erysipelotrichaceae bacterium OttesenSCG-928-M19]|nr:hypothetical protein [Erysipelotrichaceae bacterium OttesenSCG-928-M19]